MKQCSPTSAASNFQMFSPILLTNHNPIISTPQNIKASITQFTDFVSSILKICTSAFNPSSRQTLPPNIRQEHTWNRHLRSFWQRSRDPTLNPQLNKQTLLVRYMLSSHRDNEWLVKLGSFENRSDERSSSSFYLINRRLLNKPSPVHPFKVNDGSLILDPASKAEILADSKKSQFKIPESSQPLNDFILGTVHNHNHSTLHQKDMFFSSGEVQNTIHCLQKRPWPRQYF